MVRNAILVREKGLSLVAVTWHFLSCVVVSPHPCWSRSSLRCFVLFTKSPHRHRSVRGFVSAPSLRVAFPGCTWVCRRITSPLERRVRSMCRWAPTKYPRQGARNSVLGVPS